MTGRDAVLETIRENLRRARQHQGTHAPARGPASGDPSVGALPTEGLVDRFTAELTALGGQVHRVADGAAAMQVVIDVCRQHGAARVLSWHEREIGVTGLLAALNEAGVGVEFGDLPSADDREARLGELDPIQVGVTGAAGAIAESGTIALVSGHGRGRLASLLPPVHVALLPVDRLHASLPALLAAHPDLVDRGSNLVLITGPSRTADIEMTLTRGVHGPGVVHVVLVGG